MLKRIIVALSLFSGLCANPVKFLSPNILNVPTGYVISSTGYYVLTDNVIFTNLNNATNGITITSSSVTLDLNGKTLQGRTGGTGQIGVRIINTVGNITIKNGVLQFWSGFVLAWTTSLSDIVLENVQLLSSVLSGGLLASGRRISMNNCVVGNNGGSGAVFSAITDLYIKNCKFLATGGVGPGMSITTASSGQITDCVFSGNGGAGLSLASASGIMVSNCTAMLNTLTGIELVGTGSCLIRNCIAEKNGTAGIALGTTATLNLVQECIALSNGTAGIVNANTSNVVMSCLSTRNTFTDYLGTIGFIALGNPFTIAAGTVIDPRNNIVI